MGTGFTVPDFKIGKGCSSTSSGKGSGSRFISKKSIPADGLTVALVGAGRIVKMHTFFGKGRPSAMCVGKEGGCEHCKAGDIPVRRLRLNAVVGSNSEAQILELNMKTDAGRFQNSLKNLKPDTNYVKVYYNRTTEDGDLIEGLSFKDGGVIEAAKLKTLKAVRLQNLDR